ncbi:hypothetical protein ACPTIG_32195, partial [Pseudomonas aeruginosa]|uniref:hypothetical protein n=1 Tax=Pseudomonas aeruginosa TaxID=287 RepID=UPI003CC51DD1
AKAEQKPTRRSDDDITNTGATTALRWITRDNVRLHFPIARLRQDSRRAHNVLANRLLLVAMREQVGIVVFQACAAKA